MTDGERLCKFDADFAKLKRNREQVSLEQLQTRYAASYRALVAEVLKSADWFINTYIDKLSFPIDPNDKAGNQWLKERILAIWMQEESPGGRVEQCRAALIGRLDMDAFKQLVWEIYDRLEREAFDPYWQRHCRRSDSGWIYNDIFKKFWYAPERQGENKAGFWINSDYTGGDGRFPPHIREE